MLACEVWDVAPSCWKYPIESSSSSNWFTATFHTSKSSMTEIQSFFGDRFILKGLWPQCSPSLTPPDYFLWGYLKGRVYQTKPRSIDALKANITEEIQAVTADLLARTFQNMVRRIQSCLDANGGHFHHMLWCRHISHTTNVLLFKFRCNIFIGVRIIKEMPRSVASGTPCTSTHCNLKAYCAILVRRSNFRHQASPRMSPRESTQRRKVNCGRKISGNFA